MSRSGRDRVIGTLLAIAIAIAMAAGAAWLLWPMLSGENERACIAAGGYIEWEVDRAASTAYGRCVLP